MRRRKVWRVAGGYGVVGWLIIQFAVTVFPALVLPAWTARLVIILVLTGFPIALILAWAFDVSSAGIALLHRKGHNLKIQAAALGALFFTLAESFTAHRAVATTTTAAQQCATLAEEFCLTLGGQW